MAISIKKLSSIRSLTARWTSLSSGKSSLRWSRHSMHSIERIFCIVIWSRQTCSFRRTAGRNLAIWMSQKSRRKDCCIRRLVHLTMRVQKFGKTSLMATRVTFGLSVVSCMRCAHWSLLSEPMIWMVSLKECSRDSIHLSTRNTRLTWPVSWQPCWELTTRSGHHVKASFRWKPSKESVWSMASLLTRKSLSEVSTQCLAHLKDREHRIRQRSLLAKLCLRLSKCLQTWLTCRAGCQNQTTKRRDQMKFRWPRFATLVTLRQKRHLKEVHSLWQLLKSEPILCSMVTEVNESHTSRACLTCKTTRSTMNTITDLTLEVESHLKDFLQEALEHQMLALWRTWN